MSCEGTFIFDMHFANDCLKRRELEEVFVFNISRINYLINLLLILIIIELYYKYIINN